MFLLLHTAAASEGLNQEVKIHLTAHNVAKKKKYI